VTGVVSFLLERGIIAVVPTDIPEKHPRKQLLKIFLFLIKMKLYKISWFKLSLSGQMFDSFVRVAEAFENVVVLPCVGKNG
jgi:hypothetical protein